MNKTYIVRLTDDERHALLQLTKSGKAAASQIKRAHILLHVDANGPHWSDAHVATALHCHAKTVRLVRQRFGEQGLAAALVRTKQVKPSRQRLLDGAKEAHLIALRCGPPPKGQAKWTLQLLAEQLVALNVVETISYETVRQTLKKTRSSRTCTSVGGFPQSTMPTLSPTWRISWISISALMIHSTRWSIWMKSRCS